MKKSELVTGALVWVVTKNHKYPWRQAIVTGLGRKFVRLHFPATSRFPRPQYGYRLPSECRPRVPGIAGPLASEAHEFLSEGHGQAHSPKAGQPLKKGSALGESALVAPGGVRRRGLANFDDGLHVANCIYSENSDQDPEA